MKASRQTMMAALGLATAAFCAGAAQVGDVVVRQQWPWKTRVNVDFLAAGTTGGVSQVSLAAYRGERLLGFIPLSVCAGDVTFSTDGAKRITFDPCEIGFIAAEGPMLDFSVDVTAEEIPAEDALYMVFDLRKAAGEAGEVLYVTEGALTNGAWGAWERDYWGPEIARTVVWTGVTNDAAYKTTHLVMRRIPEGTFPMGDPTATPQSITISKPYYIGVFEFTAAQVQVLGNAAADVADADLRKPAANHRWYYTSFPLAIHGPQSDDYNWPTGRSVGQNSISGYLRAKTGLAFDLPTEAQWEKAARGGSTGRYYASNSTAEDSALAAQLAWNRSSERSAHEVGLKKPNAYGLYDVIGNLQEFCLDWYVANYVHPTTTDPPGPDACDPSLQGQRVVKGGNYDGLASNGCDTRSYQNSTTGNAKVGFRVCCPAP